jgi:hypothetical protein
MVSRLMRLRSARIRLSSAEVDIGWCEVVDALMIADVIVVFNEGPYLPFEIARQVVIVEQNAILQGLMPALDLSLGLGMIRSTAHMLHTVLFEPPGLTRTIVA